MESTSGANKRCKQTVSSTVGLLSDSYTAVCNHIIIWKRCLMDSHNSEGPLLNAVHDDDDDDDDADCHPSLCISALDQIRCGSMLICRLILGFQFMTWHVCRYHGLLSHAKCLWIYVNLWRYINFILIFFICIAWRKHSGTVLMAIFWENLDLPFAALILNLHSSLSWASSWVHRTSRNSFVPTELCGLYPVYPVHWH